MQPQLGTAAPAKRSRPARGTGHSNPRAQSCGEATPVPVRLGGLCQFASQIGHLPLGKQGESRKAAERSRIGTRGSSEPWDRHPAERALRERGGSPSSAERSDLPQRACERTPSRGASEPRGRGERAVRGVVSGARSSCCCLLLPSRPRPTSTSSSSARGRRSESYRHYVEGGPGCQRGRPGPPALLAEKQNEHLGERKQHDAYQQVPHRGR